MSSVALDIQGIQSAGHRDRGVARYVLELALALERDHGDHMGAYLLNADLGPPGRIEPLIASGKIDAPLPDGGIFHVGSPFELEVPIERIWPAAASGKHMRLVVTLFDLIPEVFSDFYLADPGLRRRYHARQQLVRAADHVVTLSQSTANDAVERWDIDPARVTVIGAGVAPFFQPATSRSDALTAALGPRPGLEPQFVMYQGGMDDRKNLDRLLSAYASLPVALRREWQLVVVCAAGPLQLNHYRHIAAGLGIDDRVLLTGFVPDDVLLTLYQSTGLFVFPSIYEGYGLPVAEAMACGAPTIASSTSSVGELVEPAAAFDPHDTVSIAASIERALTDAEYHTWLERQSARPAPTWSDVAVRTVAAYDRVAELGPASWRRRPLVAFTTPLPPAGTGVARYSSRLVDCLHQHCDVDVFADGLADTPGVPAPPASAHGQWEPVDRLVMVERCRGGYDAVVYTIGNSEFHIRSLAALRRRPGAVLAHDVRLTGLYALGVGYPDAVPGGFHACLQRMYGDGVPADLGVEGRVPAADADRYGVLMAREIVGMSKRFFTTSEFAARLAATDVGPEESDRIAAVPFAMQRPDAELPGIHDGPAVVASFGVINAVKQTALLVEAFALIAPARPQLRLALVGPASEVDRNELLAAVDQLGVADRVTLAGEVDDEDYAHWMDRATVAVQLRASTNGESSAAIGNCLASGVPTVVTAIGANRDLPDDAVTKVAPDVSAEELAASIADLLDDEPRRRNMAAAASRVAAAHTFERAAAALADELGLSRSAAAR